MLSRQKNQRVIGVHLPCSFYGTESPMDLLQPIWYLVYFKILVMFKGLEMPFAKRIAKRIEVQAGSLLL